MIVRLFYGMLLEEKNKINQNKKLICKFNNNNSMIIKEIKRQKILEYPELDNKNK
jgi:hypothetical protein